MQTIYDSSFLSFILFLSFLLFLLSPNDLIIQGWPHSILGNWIWLHVNSGQVYCLLGRLGTSYTTSLGFGFPIREMSSECDSTLHTEELGVIIIIIIV